MDKVLVFTNYNSGYQGLPSVRRIDEWYDSYPDESNPIVLCRYDKQVNGPTLQPVNHIIDEGIYLVYDEIERGLLDNLLIECGQMNDRICVLTHSKGNYKDLSYFNQWKNI